MPNAALILETALLILAAFLVGCVVGALARRMSMPRVMPEAKVAAEPAAKASGPPLVTAPTIAPLPGTRRRTPAERLAAAAGRDADPLETIAPAVPPIAPVPQTTPLAADAPAPVAAPAEPPAPQATPEEAAPIAAVASESVIILPPPTPSPETAPLAMAPAAAEAMPLAAIEPAPRPATEPIPAVSIEPDESFVAAVLAAAPDVEPEPIAASVAAADVPPIDEAAHVVERVVGEPEPVSAASPELIATEPEPIVPTEPAPAPAETAEPTSRTALFEDDESAAMRAIEGGWTPRRRTAAAQRPVEHPEHTRVAEVDDAMRTARTAVASATAAAAAAIAEAQERPRRPVREGPSFEQRSEELARSFLAGSDDDALPVDPPESLDFEAARPVQQDGLERPEGLASAREGKADNLKLISGISPSLEASLNGLGVFHFDQIANWDQKAVVWMDNHLALDGRIDKDRWLDQARELESDRAQAARPMKR